MTEQIMINDVDVSGCLHFQNKNNECIITHFINGAKPPEQKCSLAPHCEYKQLQRKTAECEDLKSKLQIATDVLEKIVDRRNQCSKCSDYEAGYCFGTSECWEDDIKSAQQALERIKE